MLALMTIILNVAKRFPVSLVISFPRRSSGRGRKLLTFSSSSLEPLFQPNWTLFFEKDLSLCKCRPHRLHRENNLELLKICWFFQTFSGRKQEKLSLVRSIYRYGRFKFRVGWGYEKKGKGVCQIFTLEYIGKNLLKNQMLQKHP